MLRQVQQTKQSKPSLAIDGDDCLRQVRKPYAKAYNAKSAVAAEGKVLWGNDGKRLHLQLGRQRIAIPLIDLKPICDDVASNDFPTGVTVQYQYYNTDKDNWVYTGEKTIELQIHERTAGGIRVGFEICALYRRWPSADPTAWTWYPTEKDGSSDLVALLQAIKVAPILYDSKPTESAIETAKDSITDLAGMI